MKRRHFFQQMGLPLAAASLASLASAAESAHGNTSRETPPQCDDGGLKLAPVNARADRITGVYTCTRPFRLAGPRIEMERLGQKHIVHNYGHGGSGWSLSWGSSMQALRLARTTHVRELGVIGCGALGLTSALLAQRAGMSVRIYARELPPDVASMRATGLWTPDSRICDLSHAPLLAKQWEEMTRYSHAMYQSMLGLPGNPVEWIEGYSLSSEPFERASHPGVADEPDYGEFGDSVADLRPRSVELTGSVNPFPAYSTRRFSIMRFNISYYARMLMADFLGMGGKIVVRDFSHPRELQRLPEPTLINATGYGAKALFGDDSVIPVRGQTARLIPQPEVNYALRIRNISMVPRSDGLIIQEIGNTGDFNNADATPDRAASESLVASLADLLKA